MRFGLEAITEMVDSNTQRWTVTENSVLIESLQQLCQEGCLPVLNHENLTRVQTLIKSRLPGSIKKSPGNILARFNWLKRRYFAIREMRAKGILDWDEDRMMLVGDEARYQKFAMGSKRKRRLNLYRVPFPLYELLEKIYGNGMLDGNNGNVTKKVDEGIDLASVPLINVKTEEPSSDQPRSQGISPRNDTKEVDEGVDLTTVPSINVKTEELTCDQPQAQVISPRENTKKGDEAIDLTSVPSINVRTQEPTSDQLRSQRIRSREDSSCLSDSGRRVRPKVEKTSDNSATLEASVTAMGLNIAGLGAKIDGLVNAFAGDKNDVADLQSKLFSELKNVLGLRDFQVFRAMRILAPNHDLLRVFFTVPDEMKKPYLLDLFLTFGK